MLIMKECFPTYKLEQWDYEKLSWEHVRSFYDYGHALSWYKNKVESKPIATYRLIKVFYLHEMEELD